MVMSGSFFGSRETLNEIGLKRPVREIKVKSEFPPENGPIFRVPVAAVNFENKSETFPKVLAAVDRILTMERGRGVIHAQSFDNVDAISAAMRPENRDRLWLHRRADDFDRDDFIRSFKEDSPPGAILTSPSVTEGLDLPGELGEFVIFPKAPYASKKDERVVRRSAMSDGEAWYERKAIQRTIQGKGRILRQSDDRGNCWLLDLNHIRLLNRYYLELPDWFSAALDAGDRVVTSEVRDYVTRWA